MRLHFNLFPAVIFTGILLAWHSAYALESETNLQQLKQEIITELLHSDLLKQKIADEIKAYETQKPVQNQAQLQPQQAIEQNRIQKLMRPVSSERDHIYGNADALISVVEFSDFECPYCRKIHPVLKRLVDDSQGKINWVFRHYPLSFHKPNAQQEAESAECAGYLIGQHGFWQFTDALFQQPRRGIQNRQSIIDRAVGLAGLDKESLLDCLNSAKFKDKVKGDEDEALSLGLQGTPANVLINHKTGQVVFRQGAASLETLLADVSHLLGKGN